MNLPVKLPTKRGLCCVCSKKAKHGNAFVCKSHYEYLLRNNLKICFHDLHHGYRVLPHTAFNQKASLCRSCQKEKNDAYQASLVEPAELSERDERHIATRSLSVAILLGKVF